MATGLPGLGPVSRSGRIDGWVVITGIEVRPVLRGSPRGLGGKLDREDGDEDQRDAASRPGHPADEVAAARAEGRGEDGADSRHDERQGDQRRVIVHID